MSDDKSEATVVDPLVYRRIFQSDPDGQKILEELLANFYDRPSFVAGESDTTAYREGQRAAVFFILEKLQQ